MYRCHVQLVFVFVSVCLGVLACVDIARSKQAIDGLAGISNSLHFVYFCRIYFPQFVLNCHIYVYIYIETI
jgi:hypothetical protein